MKISELREKDTGSLRNMEKELAEGIFAARLQKRTGQLENVAKIGQQRKELARVKTILRARELGLEVIETRSPDAAPKKEKKAEAKPAAKKNEKKGAKKPAAKAKAASKPAKKTKAAAKPAKKAKSAGKKK